MTTLTIPVDDDLAARLRAVAAARGEDLNQYAVAALAEAADRDAAEEAARAEARAILNGPFHDFAKSAEEMRRKYNLPDLSHLSAEELAEQAEESIARMDPAVRVEMERQGLL